MDSSKDYQTKIAGRLRETVRNAGLQLRIGAVGLITQAEQARTIVEMTLSEALQSEASAAQHVTDAKGQEPMADVVLVGRQFLREPEWVLKVAWQLGVDVAWPSQFWKVKFP